MTLFVIHLLLAFAWAAVTGTFTLPNLLLGFLLGWASLQLILTRRASYMSRSWRAAGLAWLFLVELVKSAWSVALMVVRPRLDLSPGIIAYPLQVKSDVEITLLANLITLTPGTLSVDVSEDRRMLYIHSVDCSNPQQMCRDIAEGFERKVRDVFA